ncbi:MAG: nicotinate-nucleotide--dimethylbenzimidazole phosphoribosyltransferase [bacterium]|nr:nicotinate-nucleotide--dimethylbenzimidazole phosphoribosyltransferase [bacterium]
MELLQKTIENIGSLNQEAMEKAQERLDYLLKPPGSLGKLEDIAKRLAGISGEVMNRVDKKTIVVMASDNGVVEEKVTSFPQEVSGLVAKTMATGISGVAVLARHAGASLKVVDLGLVEDTGEENVINKKIRKGTSNIAQGPAMSREEAVQAIETGIAITNQAIDEGAELIGTGEVGIGNTTTSSAVLYALTRGNLDVIVGRGAGLDDAGLALKKKVVAQAVEVNNPDPGDAVDVLAKVGGFDLAGLAGCYLAAASRRIPVVIDGFISGVAAVAAIRLKSEAREFMFTSHGSVEPGTALVTEVVGLSPMLNMNMRLGEGTGCALAFLIIEAATKMMLEMGTFGDVGM